MLGGSFYLFSLGLRASNDVDIYMIYKNDFEKLKKEINCHYDIVDGKPFTKIALNPMKYGIYYGFKGNLKENEFSRRYQRFIKNKSKNALADLLILKYYFNYGETIIVEDMNKLLFRRYKNFIKKIM